MEIQTVILLQSLQLPTGSFFLNRINPLLLFSKDWDAWEKDPVGSFEGCRKRIRLHHQDVPQEMFHSISPKNPGKTNYRREGGREKNRTDIARPVQQ